jgi:hypothetical protein
MHRVPNADVFVGRDTMLSMVRRAQAPGLSPLSGAKWQRRADRAGLPNRGIPRQALAEGPQPSAQSVEACAQKDMPPRSNPQ